MKKDWWNREFVIMMTLGESTTAGGWTSCRERSWPHLLAGTINEYQRVPVQLVNLGIGANVISVNSPAYPYSGRPAADERLEGHVLSYMANGNHLVPDLLIISYGLNDARGGTPLGQFCASLRDMVCKVREKTAPLILLAGPYYMNDFTLGGATWSHASIEIFKEYNMAIRDVANETECLFADLLSSYDNADWLIHYDGCHANDLGHRIVANKIFEALAGNCSGLANETKYLEKQIVPWRDESTLQGRFA